MKRHVLPRKGGSREWPAAGLKTWNPGASLVSSEMSAQKPGGRLSLHPRRSLPGSYIYPTAEFGKVHKVEISLPLDRGAR